MQHVVVRTEFAGLKGRRLATDHDGSLQGPGVAANDEFGSGVTLRWSELRDGYFEALRRVALPVFDLFPHGGYPASEWLTRERVEQEFARFQIGSVRLFDD